MNTIDQIAVIILTYNEEINIGRTLSGLTEFQEVHLIDSGSVDRTIEIANSFSNVTIHSRPFDNHTDQWNFGLTFSTKDWVLSMDADYFVTEHLVAEIKQLNLQYDAYRIPFKYCINGRPLRATILPPRISLFRKSKSTYYQDGHTQLLSVNGMIGELGAHILHDDRKPLSRWLISQDTYANLEIEKLTDQVQVLSMPDKIRKHTILSPLLIFFYCLFIKGLIFDGHRGLFYTLQRTYFELLLLLKRIDRKYKINLQLK